MLNGNPTLFDYLQKHHKELQVLQHYNYYDKGIDRGILIREKLSWVNRVLDSREFFLEEKNKAGQLLNNMTLIDVKGISSSGQSSPTEIQKESAGFSNTLKKKLGNLKIKLGGEAKQEDTGMQETLMEDFDIDHQRVHFNSVPVTKKFDSGFFKEAPNSKASNNDAKCTLL